MAWQNRDNSNFLLDGKQVKRDVVVARIKEVLNDRMMSCAEIEQAINLEHKSTHYCLRYMVTTGEVLTKKMRRWTHYFLPVNCELDNIFHPEFKHIRELNKKTTGKNHSSDKYHTKANNPNMPQSHYEHLW